MKIKDHLDKDNLHHAYLVIGTKEQIVPEINEFLSISGVSVIGNPDFYVYDFDSIKIEDARNIKAKSTERSFSGGKKIFIISANNFLNEAQNTLLKMFEEPIENTHFFVVLPRINILLKTLASRFYIIQHENDFLEELSEAKKFLQMQPKDRIVFLKDFLLKEEDEEVATSKDSPRSKAIRFINAIEENLHEKNNSLSKVDYFYHLFKVREYLNQPGSSYKTLMESVALCVPVIK